MKKIVIFGGGTGLSTVLTGLKLFPVDVTAVITVSDDGSSTGILKEELNIPAVGDVGKVLLAMANVDEDFLDLLGYRFHSEGSLHNHPVRNILLAALIDLKGDLTSASKYMSKLLQVKGSVLPLTTEKVELVGHGYGEQNPDGPGTDACSGANSDACSDSSASCSGQRKEFFGEMEVTNHIKDIDYLTYDHPIKVNADVIEKIGAADLIIFSPGSLYTSIIPHLISPEVLEALEESSAPIMYVSNLVSQPGETDGYSVSDHVAVLNRYLGERKIDVVIANDGPVADAVAGVYRAENKTVVELDTQNLESVGVPASGIIADDIVVVDEAGSVRHNTLKTAYLVFSFLMEQDKK